MPIKKRGTLGCNTLPYWYGGAGPYYPALQDPCSVPYEIIKDERPQRMRFGNCHHVKVGIARNEVFYTPGTSAGKTVYPLGNVARWTPCLPDAYDIDWNQFNGEAYDAMRPSFTSDLNLTNFLLELGEFKDLFKIWKRGQGLLKNLASGHLNLSFGWKPTIGDLKKLYEQLQGFTDNYERFKSQIGKVQTSHFRKTLDDQTMFNHSWSGYPHYWAEGVIDREFFATMRYTYSAPGLESKYGKAKALLDSLGLALNAAVIWEAIPFSFVVDWFINVGSFLESRAEDHVDIRVTVLDYCCSVKAMEKGTCHYDYDRAGGTPTTEAAGAWRSTYVRRRCLPNTDGFGITTSERYGLKQIILSAALLIA